MRHKPAGAAIIIMLHSPKMSGLTQGVYDLMKQGSPSFETVISMLSQLSKTEMVEREVH